MKKTEWFPADVKPVRFGIYECDRYIPADKDEPARRQRRFLEFDYLGWRYPEHGLPAMMFVSQHDKWRGLAEKPE